MAAGAGASVVGDVFCAAGATAGVAVDRDSGRLRSFGIPGFANSVCPRSVKRPDSHFKRIHRFLPVGILVLCRRPLRHQTNQPFFTICFCGYGLVYGKGLFQKPSPERERWRLDVLFSAPPQETLLPDLNFFKERKPHNLTVIGDGYAGENIEIRCVPPDALWKPMKFKHFP